MPPAPAVAASVLLAPLLDGASRRLTVVHTSELAWQLADESDRAVASVIFPGAVRLPSAICVPEVCEIPSSVSVGDGAVTFGGRSLPVARWWRPARPRTPLLRGRVDVTAVEALAGATAGLVGRGPGLTPYGDDVLAGAIVACHAAGAGSITCLAEAVRSLDLDRRTTPTSALLLRQAMNGYCIDPVAGYLRALADPGADADLAAAKQSLLRVGHTSGAGLLEGIHLVIPAGESAVAA